MYYTAFIVLQMVVQGIICWQIVPLQSKNAMGMTLSTDCLTDFFRGANPHFQYACGLSFDTVL